VGKAQRLANVKRAGNANALTFPSRSATTPAPTKKVALRSEDQGGCSGGCKKGVDWEDSKSSKSLGNLQGTGSSSHSFKNRDQTEGEREVKGIQRREKRTRPPQSGPEFAALLGRIREAREEIERLSPRVRWSRTGSLLKKNWCKARTRITTGGLLNGYAS